MTLMDEYQRKLRLFKEHVEAAKRSADMLAKYHRELLAYYPFKAEEVINIDPDIEILIYAFFKKYEQLVVLLNDNILKNIPYFELENMAKMSRFDTIAFSEKMGVVKSARRFVDAVALRNQLAHEYPLDAVQQTRLLNSVIVETEELLQAMAALQAFVQKRLHSWNDVRLT